MMSIRTIKCLVLELEKTLPALVFASVLLLHLHQIAAQPSVIPSELQAAIFAKVFNYGKKIRKPNGKYKVVIVVSDKYQGHAKSIAGGFSKVKVQTVFAKWDELSSKMSDASAVYLFGYENIKAIEKLCYRHKVLSLSGNPDLARAGQVAVAIGISNNKPQIMVNLNRAKREGHGFSSQLLKLVKVLE